MKKFIFALTAFFAISSVLAIEPDAITPSGSGTASDPYLIESIGNLVWMSNSNCNNKYFSMINDIDAAETTNWYDGAGFKPLSFYNTVFDGCGHTIYNLYINRNNENNVGFIGSFAATNQYSFVKNLNIINSEVYGGAYVGTIVGQIIWGKVKTQSGSNRYYSPIIQNCYAVGKVIGALNVGGIVGSMPYGLSEGYAVLSFSRLNIVINNFYKGEIIGVTDVGGIIGSGCCRECTSLANIEGRNFVGGVSGLSGGRVDASQYADIIDCFTEGSVKGKNYVGGIIGRGSNWGRVKTCFSENIVNGDAFIGGIIGGITNYGCTAESSYFNLLIAPTNQFGVGLTLDQLSKKIYYNFDFREVWDFNEDFQRPRLKCMKYVKASADKGTVTVYPEKDVYFTNDFVELSATPWPGHEFKYFKINENIITNNNCSYPVTENLSIKAFFEPNEDYDIDFDITGEGRVEVSPNQESYYWGDKVTLSAYPEIGYQFSNYQIDDLVITNSVYEYVVTGNQTINVTFTPIDYRITREVVGSGTITLAPQKSFYNYGDVVDITASKGEGYHFNFLVVDGVTNYTETVQLVVSGNHSVKAYFSIDLFSINVAKSYGGNVSVSPELEAYPYDTYVTVTATPNSGYEFKGYSGTYTNSDQVITFNIRENVSLRATFTSFHYKVTLVDSDYGRITVSPYKDSYDYNEQITLTAIPNDGYKFKRLICNGTGFEDNSVTLAVVEDITAEAEFIPESYYVGVNDSTGGSLEISPRKDAYDYNEVITLTATPSAGYELKRVYNDNFSSTNLVSQYTVKGTTSFTAEFIQRNYRCIVTPSGGGSVTVAPSQGTYHYGDVITITATPDTGYAFKQYSGSITDSNKVCVVTIQDHLNITAEFELASYTVTLNGSTGGTLSVSPVKDKYKYNEEITLTAAPSEGYELRKVYNDTYSSTNRVSKYVVKGDTWFTPDFVQREYRCIVTTSEGGTVSVTPSQTTYHYGDVITLTAVSETGYAFKEYSGSVTSKDKVCVVTVKDHLNINAEFYFDAYELVAKATEGGSISIDPEKETYHANEKVKVSAASIEGYSFAGFTGTVESKDNPLEVLMNQHHDITAVFTNVEYKVVVAVSEGGKLSIEPSQDYYHFNDELSFSVKTDPGWHLEEILGYYESITNTTGTLTVKSDLTLTPVFVLNEYKVSVDVVYGGEVTLSPYKNTYHYNDAIKIICKPYDSYVLERLVINGTDTEEYEFVLTDDTEILAVFGYEPVKPEGAGSKDDPYQIATVANLFWLSRNSYMSPDTYSVLKSDLDISICKDWQNGKGFEPIGTLEHPYGGTFDGQGFSISGLYIDDDEAVNAGLFGYAKDAEITDLNIFDAAVRGKENCGGLVGYCYNCSIDNVYVNAQVYADINAGGLVGSANYATIQRSSSEKTVSGNENLGGILGKGTDCTVANCFTTAKMNGYDSIGGIIGSSIFSTVSYCYAAGGITANTTQGGIVGASQDSTVVSSFFDKTQARENGYGTGVTAQELYSRATFSDWDFINIWEQYDGITRPFLRGGEDSNWQKLAGASTGKISISGVLSGDDLETIKANKTVCVYSLMDNTLLAEPVQLSGTSLKTKEVKVQYNAKKRSFKYSSTVPQLTVGAFNDEGVLQCQLNSSKKKLDCSLVFDNDITDTIGNSQVSLCDDFMNNGCLTGTKIQLTDKGKSLTYKGTVNDVTLQVNIALKTGKVSIKYSSKNKISAVVSK